MYENDVLVSIKKGATSFHVSEERWNNPMQLSTNLKKEELNNLRIGWDLVLDIDCPNWYFSKLSTHLFIKALKEHGIKSISCKFSGNKGFHIGVPFESFPIEINNLPLKNWFPEGPKRIALYLLDYIAGNLIEVNENVVLFDKIYKKSIKEIAESMEIPEHELKVIKCTKCKRKRDNKESKIEFICNKCEKRIFKNVETKFLVCPKCKILMEKMEHQVACSCGSSNFQEFFDPLTIIDLDTLLISSRHMYRAPYSMHEKSGKISIPIYPKEVMTFEKENANPEMLNFNHVFLDVSRAEKEEGRVLIVQAFDYQDTSVKFTEPKKYELPEEAIPEEYFALSIKKGLQGLKDGRKRFLFILINFLMTVGWTHPKIVERVADWNQQNSEPLKENYVQSQLNYSKTKKPVPPPNYNTGYYRDLGIADKEAIMLKYKNPVTYTKVLYEQNKKRSRKLTKEQKEMRRKYREKKNENKS
jgi:hypothetical protein